MPTHSPETAKKVMIIARVSRDRMREGRHKRGEHYASRPVHSLAECRSRPMGGAKYFTMPGRRGLRRDPTWEERQTDRGGKQHGPVNWKGGGMGVVCDANRARETVRGQCMCAGCMSSTCMVEEAADDHGEGVELGKVLSGINQK